MNRKTERDLRLRSLKLRTALFFKRNGLYLGMFALLALLGAAALMLSSPEKTEPVRRSDDERLADVSASPGTEMTAPPTPATPVPASPAPTAARTSAPTLPPRTPTPDLTAAPDVLAEPTGVPALSRMQPPVDGHIIRSFAVSSLIWSETLQQWMTHPGVDIAANKGDPVYAVLAGTVESVYADDMLGVTVVIAHENGLTSVYSSLKDAPEVKPGDAVTERQIVGYIGDTAIGECAERSHLHFELLFDGAPIDPQSAITFDKE